MSLLPQLVVFALTLAALIALGRWTTRQIQIIALRLTGSERLALLGYYLLLLPGILLHELSHVGMAWLLGLRVGKFSLGPKLRGRYVELGSVQVSTGGALRDSLVGLAPFLAGTAVLLLVGYLVFDVAALGLIWQTRGWPGVTASLGSLSDVPDFWVWAYVMFAASNAMIPSPADRQPWLAAGMYVGLALVVTYALGGFPLLADAFGVQVSGAVQLLTLAFVFTLVLNMVAALLLLALDVLISQLQALT
jgi:hypothetical protein